MDSVPNSPDIFVCEVPEVGKTEICCTKRQFMDGAVILR
jgi:hypothetical protein